MITVYIRDDEPKVIELTYENLFKELKDIPKSEIVIVNKWFEGLDKTKNPYTCFVEADCLVNSGYFSSQLGLIKKNSNRNIAVLSSATAMNDWGNRFYGYHIGNNYTDGLIPSREKKSKHIYPVQVGFLPGALVRRNMLGKIMHDLKWPVDIQRDLRLLSTVISFEFWKRDGFRVYINPNSTYVSTDDSINNISHPNIDVGNLPQKFASECI